MVAPGIGTAIGSKLGSLASGLFEVELEGMPQEQAEYEVARRYVGLAASAARNAALARPRPGVSPVSVARATFTAGHRHTIEPIPLDDHQSRTSRWGPMSSSPPKRSSADMR